MSGKVCYSSTTRTRSSEMEPNLNQESKRLTVLWAIVIILALMSALWFSRSYFRKIIYNDGQNPFGARHALLLSDKERNDRIDLLTLLPELSRDNEDIRESGRKRIVELGRQSKENRQVILLELVRRVGASDFRQQLATKAGSFFWVEACQIFSELKAIEAMDVLIDCIDCPAVTQPASERYRHKPAIGALIGLGEPAVPRLTETLANPNPQLRIYACVCLGNIQGSAARQALTGALAVELDSNVEVAIRRAIAAIDRGI